MTNEIKNNLTQFLGAYFHQDWTLEATDPDEVIRLFINDVFSADELMNVANNIDTYAVTKADDTVTEESLLTELGCYYLPSADGIGARAWLYHVSDLLRSSCEQSGKVKIHLFDHTNIHQSASNPST